MECPISQERMEDPVVAGVGNRAWNRQAGALPVTEECAVGLSKDLVLHIHVRKNFDGPLGLDLSAEAADADGKVYSMRITNPNPNPNPKPKPKLKPKPKPKPKPKANANANPNPNPNHRSTR